MSGDDDGDDDIYGVDGGHVIFRGHKTSVAM